MIYIVDMLVFGTGHVMFNASMVKIFEEMYPTEKIGFFAEADHLEHVKKYFANEKNISFIPIELKKTHAPSKIKKSVQMVQKIKNDLQFLTKILKRASPNDKIYICGLAPFSFLCFRHYSRLFKKRTIIMTLHGEVEYVYAASDKREKGIGNLYRKILAIKGSNFYYLMLNKISKAQIMKDKIMDESQYIEIDHPFIFKDITTHVRENGPLILGHVGSLGLRKRSEMFYELAAKFDSEIKDQKVRFMANGTAEPNIISYVNDYVEQYSKENRSENGYLARNSYEENIRNMDYVLFFFAKDQFIFRASGALLDVIEQEKPIIVLDHPYFKYLFDVAGNIGFICKDLDEMKQLIDKLINKDANLISQYEEQVKNLKGYKQKKNLANIALDFKKQLETHMGK